MTEEELIQTVKENNKWAKKVYLTIWSVTVAVVAIIGLIFGKLVEATAFAEVAKWVVMAIAIGLLVCGLCYVPVTMLKDARRKYYPEFGKGWFKQLWKDKFKKK